MLFLLELSVLTKLYYLSPLFIFSVIQASEGIKDYHINNLEFCSNRLESDAFEYLLLEIRYEKLLYELRVNKEKLAGLEFDLRFPEENANQLLELAHQAAGGHNRYTELAKSIFKTSMLFTVVTGLTSLRLWFQKKNDQSKSGDPSLTSKKRSQKNKYLTILTSTFLVSSGISFITFLYLLHRNNIEYKERMIRASVLGASSDHPDDELILSF